VRGVAQLRGDCFHGQPLGDVEPVQQVGGQHRSAGRAAGAAGSGRWAVPGQGPQHPPAAAPDPGAISVLDSPWRRENSSRPRSDRAPRRCPDDEEDPDRWLAVWYEGSREGYRDMQDFLGTVTDPSRADRLSIAVSGRGAFRRFKDVPARRPAELEALARVRRGAPAGPGMGRSRPLRG
jgi:hypothetical protein